MSLTLTPTLTLTHWYVRAPQNGTKPLMWAAVADGTDIAKLLILNKANVNAINKVSGGLSNPSRNLTLTLTPKLSPNLTPNATLTPTLLFRSSA